MATQIQLQSTNYNGQLADITFYPCSGGSISLGVQTIPYTYTNDDYEGTYDLFFSAFSQTCQLVITCPTPTPTVTTTNTPTPTITPTNTSTPTPTASSIPSGTTEANAYLSAVVDAGGTGITPTISAATRTLFTSLVSNGLYDKLFAMYPMIGGNSNGCKFNALNPLDTNAAYRITFNGGWTFDYSGATPNGTNAYGNTYVNPTSVTTSNNIHLSYESLTNSAVAGSTTMGVDNPGYARMILRRDGDDGRLLFGSTTKGNVFYNITNSIGYFIGCAITDDNTRNFYKNGVLLTPTFETGLSTSILPNYNIFISANSAGGGPGEYDNKKCSFSTIGEGLTTGEASTLSTIINTFQTTLGRNTY